MLLELYPFGNSWRQRVKRTWRLDCCQWIWYQESY